MTTEGASLSPGASFTAEELTHAARTAWEASGLTQAVAAEQLGVSRVTFAHAIGEPDRSLLSLRRRIIEAFSPFDVVGPTFTLHART